MSERRLRETLQQLHEELDRTESVGAEERALLKDLMADIQHTLEKPEEGTAERHQSLNERLREAAGDFEEAHPSLTLALRRVVDAFRWMSI
jgi:hypothetical protein